MIPGQNLKCQNPADVYLLLKSSDFISHDLDHALEGCIDYPPRPSVPTPPATAQPPPELGEEELARLTISGGSGDTSASQRPYEFELVLKKWFDMPKSQEWRCFVREGVFLGAFSPLSFLTPCPSARSCALTLACIAKYAC